MYINLKSKIVIENKFWKRILKYSIQKFLKYSARDYFTFVFPILTKSIFRNVWLRDISNGLFDDC